MVFDGKLPIWTLNCTYTYFDLWIPVIAVLEALSVHYVHIQLHHLNVIEVIYHFHHHVVCVLANKFLKIKGICNTLMWWLIAILKVKNNVS